MRERPSVDARAVDALRSLALAFALLAGGCSRPDPPVVTPKSATVSKMSATGVDFQLRVEAYNPNTIALSTRSVTGKVVLDGTYDLGVVTIPRPVLLPPGERTLIDVPFATKWGQLGALALLAAQRRDVNFSVDGTMNIGSDRLSFDVPFHRGGTITSEQLLGAPLFVK